MGRVKQWALEQEEQFMDKMLEVADRSETYLVFTSEMEGHMDMVSHLGLSDIHDMMAESYGIHVYVSYRQHANEDVSPSTATSEACVHKRQR